MRFATVLVLTGLIGAAASVYTPTAQAGVYVGVRVPVPVIAPPVVVAPVVSVPIPRVYYAAPPVPYVAIGWRGPGWGYGYGHWGYHGYGHGRYEFRGRPGFYHR
jgi:hypothetical protein